MAARTYVTPSLYFASKAKYTSLGEPYIRYDPKTLSKPRENKAKTTSYFNIQFHTEDGKWVPLFGKVTKVSLPIQCKNPKDRKFPSLDLRFYKDTMSGKDGDEPFGEMLADICTQCSNMSRTLLDSGELYSRTGTVKAPIQMKATIEENGKKIKKDVDVPIVTLAFDIMKTQQEIALTAEPKGDFYLIDALGKKSPLTVNGQPLQYGNAHEIFRTGATLSITYSIQVSDSTQGLCLKFTIMGGFVEPSKLKGGIDGAFDEEELESIMGENFANEMNSVVPTGGSTEQPNPPTIENVTAATAAVQINTNSVYDDL